MPRKYNVAKAASEFWKRVDQSGGPDSCWEYTSSRTVDGYGKLGWTPAMPFYVAHRFAWFATNGPIPDGMFVCHRCDNPPCCNPAHLFIGSNADNMADMVSKGRQLSGDRNPTVTNPERVPRGEHHWSARLTEENVISMREMFKDGQQLPRIAEIFGVSKQVAHKAISGRTWAHLPGAYTRTQRSST